MSDIACKEAIAEVLSELVEKDPRIMVLCSDSRGSSGFTAFAEEHPENFVECGIAEQDEVGIAAGLAAVGLHPYVAAPACFLSARSLEQVKVDVAYSHMNVKIFGVSGGISYGALGASHHSTHDIAVMRCFPDLEVYLPSDANQMKAIVRAVEKTEKPCYIRSGRGKVPQVYQSEEGAFTYGRMNTLSEGSDITIISCGELTIQALRASRALKEEGISCRVLDSPSLKPFDSEAVVKAARETGLILTVEEHVVLGGLGAAVSQTVTEKCPVRVCSLGLPDEYLPGGTSAELFALYGLSAAGITRKVKELLGK